MNNPYLKPLVLSGESDVSDLGMVAVNTVGSAFLLILAGVCVMVYLSDSDKKKAK